MLLDIKNIDVLYDDFQVIWDVSINVKKAEMVALLGPNGCLLYTSDAADE